MRILRTLLILTLAVAVLPWGAWTGARPPVPPEAAELAAAQVVPPPDTGEAAVRKTRCRGPALPGSPCGPLFVLPDLAAPAHAEEPARSVHPVIRTSSERVFPSGPFRPPRRT